MVPSRPDGYLTTKESAALVGVSPSTIAAWRDAGLLPSLPGERGRERLHEPEAVWAAERRVRENGLAKGRCDPRRLRRHARKPEATQAGADIAA